MEHESATTVAAPNLQLERPEIDFLILADRVEALGGKLYMMGGAWDRLQRDDFSQPFTVSFAVGILIPWNATNENHQITLFLEDADGHRLTEPLQGAVNAGRPPDCVRGQTFRAVVAVNAMWPIPGPGAYRVVATLASGARKTVTLYVVGPPTGQQPQ